MSERLYERRLWSTRANRSTYQTQESLARDPAEGAFVLGYLKRIFISGE